MTNLGILGIGVYLPPTIRTNDWWPRVTVEGWIKRQQGSGKPVDMSALPAGMQKTLQAMEALRDDPFRGSRERRVLADDLQSSDMEIAAAKAALEQSGFKAGDIDLLITYSHVPDYLLVNPACRVHHALGLSEHRCLAYNVNGACDAFQQQLAIASALIASGKARRALLVQSWCGSRVMTAEEPFSAWFGDGGTAVVLGEVEKPYGILGHVQSTDGSKFEGLVMGVPGKRWHEDGSSTMYLADVQVTQKMLTDAAERARLDIHAALDQARVKSEEIDFFACHQATNWLRPVVQDFAGLGRARTVDTFAQYASIGASNIPLILSIAEKDGLLKKGNLVTMFAAGAGETRSATVLRWARS